MSKLSATFQIDLPGNLIVDLPKEETIICECQIDEFEITIQFSTSEKILTLEGRSATSFGYAKDSHTEHWIHPIEQVTVVVRKNESEEPPESPAMLGKYFEVRNKDYGNMAREVVNRLIRFFKFQLKTPYLQELSEFHQSFQNPTWTNETGRQIDKVLHTFIMKKIPGLCGELGVKRFRKESIICL